ncbi:MAG TPA: MFS transporter [Gemmatimonadaceae bacterium]|nr:MFS transporter [Gemmatimonadaceae bacterium]
MTSKIALPAVVLVTMASVTALVTLDATIVAVALPSIARGLHASFADVEWVIGSYVLCFASLLTPVGALGDHRGRKGAVLAGISIFAIASLLCGVAQNAAFLIAARVLQGVGAAFLPPAALGIIGHEFQGPERTRAFGVWGSVIGLAVVAGPVIGGIVTSLMGWRWTFLINLPLCVVLIIAIVRWVPDSRNPEARRYDLGGSVTFCGALFFLTWALIDTHEIAPRLAASSLMLIAFIVIERRQRDPMLDLALFRRPDFLGAVAAMAGYSAAAQALVYFFPLYLQNTLHYSALVSGVAMLPYAVPLCLMPRISARASTQYGSRFVLAWGLVIVALGDLLMAITSTTLRYPMFAASMFISGIGGGLLNGETAQALQATIPTAQGGMAGGFSATVRFAAILLAVAVLGIFYSHKGTPWVMGAASIVAAMAAGLVNLPPLWMKTSGSESRL